MPSMYKLDRVQYAIDFLLVYHLTLLSLEAIVDDFLLSLSLLPEQFLMGYEFSREGQCLTHTPKKMI